MLFQIEVIELRAVSRVYEVEARGLAEARAKALLRRYERNLAGRHPEELRDVLLDNRKDKDHERKL